MIFVSEDAVEKVSDELNSRNYDLKALFKEIKKENPRIAEYIQVQSQKSRNSLEVIGTGIVVYLLLKKQFELDDVFEENTELEDFIRTLSPEDLLGMDD